MSEDNEQFHRLGKLFTLITTVVLVVIVAMAALYAVAIWRAGVADPDVLTRLGLSWLPSVFYLWALWTLRGLFANLATSGLKFQPGLTVALSRIGLALVAGGVTTLVTAPIVSLLTRPHHMGGFPIFNVPALVLVMLGIALFVLARMFRRALVLESEARGLRHVLDGFI